MFRGKIWERVREVIDFASAEGGCVSAHICDTQTRKAADAV